MSTVTLNRSIHRIYKCGFIACVGFLAVVGGQAGLSGNQAGKIELTAEFGEEGKDVGEFTLPFGVAINSQQRIIVTDKLNDRIQTCSIEGECSTFGQFGFAPGQFIGPTGVAIDHQDRIIVADSGNNRVQICMPDGSCDVLKDQDGNEREFVSPGDVAVTAAGRIVITEPSLESFKICTVGGNCDSFDNLDGNPDLMVRPQMVTIDKDGRLLFTTSPDQIWRCDQKGNCDYLFGKTGGNPSQFNGAQDLVVDESGSIFIADLGNSRLQICTEEGECSAHEIWRTSEQNNYWPAGIDLTADGQIVISERAGHKIQIYRIATLDTPINAGHAGGWFWPQTSGQGQLIDIAPESQHMFIGWFTYTEEDSDDPYQQQWFTAQGSYSGNSAVLELNETLGGKFDDPQEVTTRKVGSVTLEFHDCTNGTFSYQFDDGGPTGIFPMFRVIPGSENSCEDHQQSLTQAEDINNGMDGAWYDPETSGQGFFLDVHTDDIGDKFMFVSWFTYGDTSASGQRWLTAQGPLTGSRAEIEINETSGGSFDDPKDVETAKAGTMTIDFIDCNTATLGYILDNEGLSSMMNITRAVPGSQAMCEELIELE